MSGFGIGSRQRHQAQVELFFLPGYSPVLKPGRETSGLPRLPAFYLLGKRAAFCQ